MLTQKRLHETVDYDPETGIFRWKMQKSNHRKIGAIAGTPHLMGYWVIGIDRRRYLAHRLAWFWVHGKWPDAMIDHIDHNRQNNAIANLRQATNSENLANSHAHKRSKTGVRGVSIHRPSGRYRVQLGKNKKQIHIGYFSSFDEACRAASVAAATVHNEFGIGRSRNQIRRG